MKTTTMTAALLALTLAGAGETAAADAIINEFTAQNLSEVLGEIGGTDIAPKTDQDGITTVSAKFEGEPAHFTMVGCAAAKSCRDLQMWILFNADGDRFNATFANGFNGAWLDATAYAREDRTLMLRTLLISNGGLTREHIKEVFKVFLNSPKLLAEFSRTQGTVALLPDGIKTLSGAAAGTREPYVPLGEVARRSLPK